MRAIAYLLISAFVVAPCFGLERITVQELEQFIAAHHNQSDRDLAQNLSGLELTQRVTQGRLNRLSLQVTGRRSRETLAAISDLSAFLDLPPADLPNDGTPDSEAQRRMTSSAVDFVGFAIHKIPDFRAKRLLSRFEDLRVLRGLSQPVTVRNDGFHLINRTRTEVQFRDGREVLETVPGKIDPADGLLSWGIFGPLLGMVMEDILRGKIAWSHWESGPDGSIAVFQFEVSEAESHYAVQ